MNLRDIEFFIKVCENSDWHRHNLYQPPFLFSIICNIY